MSSARLSRTEHCPVCLAQIQNLPPNLVDEYTPLIYRPDERLRNSKWGTLLFGLLILIFFFGCTIGFYLIAVETRDIEAQDIILFSSRYNWKAESEKSTINLDLPCRKILLIYTNSSPCFDHNSCRKEIKTLQNKHMLSNHSDILYNFIISDDNRIYEGRGWKYSSGVPGYTDNATISVALLGFPGNEYPTDAVVDQVMLLISLLITNHKLIHCFEVSTRMEEKYLFQEIINRIQNTFIETRCS